MKTTLMLIKRNVKLFFKDKAMFFTALITPMILLVLYASFLGNVYRDSFSSGVPEGILLPEDIVSGLVAGQLMSSILAVSCVTVAFCSNFLMVQDKASGTINDLRMSPVPAWSLSVAYYVATLISTLIVCFVAVGICLCYAAAVGFYMSLWTCCCFCLTPLLWCFSEPRFPLWSTSSLPRRDRYLPLVPLSAQDTALCAEHICR